MADQYAPLPIKTKGTADVSVRLRNVADSAYMGDATNPVVITINNASLPVTQSGTWTVGLTNDWTIVDNAGFTDGTTRLGMAGYIFDETAGTSLTENDAAAARIDSKRAQVLVLEDATTRGQRATISAGGALKVDGSAATQPVSGSVTADTELPAAAALADATSNPTVPGVGAFLQGYNGTTWDRVRTANTGRLQVDVLSGGGSNTPTSPQRQFITVAALAIASPNSQGFTEIGAAGITAKLWQINVSSSVTCKWELFRQVNGATDGAASLVLFNSAANPTVIWNSPHPNFITIASSAGADNWIIKVTNLDNALAADVYMTLLWDQV